MPSPATPASNTVAQDAAVLHETHSAYVMLIGDTAYKMKKPVRTDFLDFTDIDERRIACQREFALNARFAPDVYLGVGELTNPLGGPSEPILTMRRLPESARLSTRAEDGGDMTSVVRSVARSIAAVHAESQRSAAIDNDGTRDSLDDRWRSNISEMRCMEIEFIDNDGIDEIEQRTHQYLAGRSTLFTKRVTDGRIVDGHGDLLADDIFDMPDGPRILDCLDFSDALRHLDQIDDICCLAMDLEYRRRPDLASELLQTYQSAAHDDAPPSLIHHYIAYRAFMRSKVACIRFRQGDEHAAVDATRHLTIALNHSRSSTVGLVLVGGLPGSGKSTLAAALAESSDAIVVSSDIVRKDNAGLDPSASHGASLDEGLYLPARVRLNYAELMRSAAGHLALGQSVIIDASWSDVTERQHAARVATDAHADLTELHCVVPRDTAVRRISKRGNGSSDATTDIYDKMAARWSPWRTAVAIDADRSPQSSVAAAHAAWLHG